MLRKKLLALGIAAALVNPSAAFIRGGTGSIGAATFSPRWQTMLLGDGGQMTGYDFHADGTALSWNNTYGGHIYKTAGTCSGWGTAKAAPCWQQLFTTNSVPPDINAVFTNFAQAGAGGIAACDSNTNVIYAIWFKAVWVSIDKGAHWVQTTQAALQNTNGGPIETGKYIACDPFNPDIVYVGNTTGVFVSLNGTNGASGGASTATWAAVTGVGTVGTKPSVIAFDPASTHGSGFSTHFWIATDGTGVYETSNGGTPQSGSFTLRNTANMPTTYFHMLADKFSQLWVADGTSALKRYVNGSGWTTSSPGVINSSVQVVAVDPTSASLGANRVIAAGYDGSISLSITNAGAWTNAGNTQSVSAPAPQPTWMATANQNASGLISINAIEQQFDFSGNLWAAGGIAAWKVVPTIAINPVWVADTVGIEQLVAIATLAPLGNPPLTNVWDRGFFTSTNPDVYPSTYWPGAATSNVFGSLGPIESGWALDWATSNTNFFTGWLGHQGFAPASSSDGGYTWNLWPLPLPSPNQLGGNIAASTPTNWLLVPGANQIMSYTTNAGVIWAASTVAGTPSWVTQFGVRTALAASRTVANTFCAVDTSLNFYSSTNSGANFTKRINAGVVDGSANADLFISVPGQPDYFYSSGSQSGAHPTNTHLWKITKTTNECDTATSVNANFKEVIAFGFGAPKPGNSYPAMYGYGWLSGVLGMYQSDDAGATWALINAPASEQTWPSNSQDYVTWVTGDMNVYGRVYVDWKGSGASYIDTATACPWVGWTSSVKPTQNFTGTVSLTAQHSGLVPVSSVNFYVDGVLIGTQTSGTGTPTTYTQSWVTGGVATGAHTLKVEAVGNGCTAGGTGNSFSIPITTS